MIEKGAGSIKTKNQEEPIDAQNGRGKKEEI